MPKQVEVQATPTATYIATFFHFQCTSNQHRIGYLPREEAVNQLAGHGSSAGFLHLT